MATSAMDPNLISNKATAIPKLGPEPTLLSRKEIDALYETLDAVLKALRTLSVDAIVTGGSLLGAIRQHSILFCDDDIDLTIIDYDGSVYEKTVRPKLQETLGDYFLYQVRPWEGGDRIRPKRMSNVFLDLFVLRKFESLDDLKELIGIKKNGQPQSEGYVQDIVEKMVACSQGILPLCPFWHFSTRKAVEMWTKEVYRHCELFPLDRNLKMGPVTGICGPRMPAKLLKRAFGNDCFDVYFQSASHQTGSKPANNHHHAGDSSTGSKAELPPLVAAGGTWEGGVKTPLDDEHYLPIQPISKAARRPTLHNREQLQLYLQAQSIREEQWTRQEGDDTSRTSSLQRRTIYMDGVFDLFHIGHLEAIRQCKALGDRVIIGVTGDKDATGYKRQPIVPEKERCAIIEALKEVDEIVCPCPLVVTEEFMAKHSIDLVVHGFANDADAERQTEFFEIPMKTGRFQRISYYDGMSTTDRIRNIQAMLEDDAASHIPEDDRVGKPQWFGSCVSAALNNSSEMSFDPFPLWLRQVVEPHISKARERRKEALVAIRSASGPSAYDNVLDRFHAVLARECDLSFDSTAHPLREALLQDLGLNDDFDLSTIHAEETRKDEILHTLTRSHQHFQSTYDEFVRMVCAPQMAKLFPCNEIYYQAFPCLRIVQPDEFSIGPHSDVAYGHHPCSVNFYVPLTKIGGTASLFLESRLGAEDWHPIELTYGRLKQFAGALCLHWTTENKADYTRVSLDFRLIPAPLFHGIQFGKDGSLASQHGYYSICRKAGSTNGGEPWIRNGPLLEPDARMGFPWTVKDWDKFWRKKKQKHV